MSQTNVQTNEPPAASSYFLLRDLADLVAQCEASAVTFPEVAGDAARVGGLARAARARIFELDALLDMRVRELDALKARYEDAVDVATDAGPYVAMVRDSVLKRRETLDAAVALADDMMDRISDLGLGRDAE